MLGYDTSIFTYRGWQVEYGRDGATISRRGCKSAHYSTVERAIFAINEIKAMRK